MRDMSLPFSLPHPPSSPLNQPSSLFLLLRSISRTHVLQEINAPSHQCGRQKKCPSPCQEKLELLLSFHSYFKHQTPLISTISKNNTIFIIAHCLQLKKPHTSLSKKKKNITKNKKYIHIHTMWVDHITEIITFINKALRSRKNLQY